MLMKLTGGRVYDPAHGVNGIVRDIYVDDGWIVDPPSDGKALQEVDSAGQGSNGWSY